MLLIAAFMRATFLVIAGYFVWFASSKAEDRLKTVGKYIAFWCFAFAGVLVVIGIAAAVIRPHGGMGGGMGHAGMGMHRPGMMGMMHRMGPGMGAMGMHRGMGFGGGREGRPNFFFRNRRDGAEPKTETPAAAPATPAAPPKS